MIYKCQQDYIDYDSIEFGFGIPNKNIHNKNIKIVIPEEFLTQNIIKLEDMSIGYGLSEKQLDESSDEPIFSDYLNIWTEIYYEENKYFCSRFGRKIKYKNNNVEIPLLNFWYEPSNKFQAKQNDLAYYMIYIAFFPNDIIENIKNNEIKQKIRNNIFIKITDLKNRVDTNYAICTINRRPYINVELFKIKYIYIKYMDFYYCFGKSHKNTVMDVWYYEDKFLDLIKNYKGIVFNIKKIHTDYYSDLIIFKIDEDSNIDNAFLSNLYNLTINLSSVHSEIEFNKNVTSRHFDNGLYLVLKSKLNNIDNLNINN